MHPVLKNNIKDLIQICRSLKVKRLYTFGSINTDEFTENSDLDFLFSFDDDISIEEYTDNYFSLLYRLQELFNRNIDLLTERMLSNPYFIESVENTKQIIYEA